MKTVCYYVADDGTKFEEESECFNYEFKQKVKDKIGKDFRLFNEDYEEITDCTLDSIYDAPAIQVFTIEGANFIVEWSKEYGVEPPFDSWDIKNKDEDLLGTWVYDVFGLGDWTHLDLLKRKVDELYFTLQ